MKKLGIQTPLFESAIKQSIKKPKSVETKISIPNQITKREKRKKNQLKQKNVLFVQTPTIT